MCYINTVLILGCSQASIMLRWEKKKKEKRKKKQTKKKGGLKGREDKHCVGGEL